MEPPALFYLNLSSVSRIASLRPRTTNGFLNTPPAKMAHWFEATAEHDNTNHSSLSWITRVTSDLELRMTLNMSIGTIMELLSSTWHVANAKEGS
jgi:hypothetical protein